MKTYQKLLIGIASATLAIGSLNAAPLYTLNMSSDGTGDFVEAQIGQIGDMGSATNVFSFDGTNNRYQLSDIYGREATYRLGSAGSTANSFSGDTYVSMSYNYMPSSPITSDPSTAFVILGLRQNPSKNAALNSNTYPVYQLVLDQGVLSMNRNWGYNNTTIFDSYTLSAGEISSTDSYRMDLSAVDVGINAFGTIVDLEASLYQNGSLVKKLTFTDTPTETAGEKAGASIASGFVSLGAGQGSNNQGNPLGIYVTDFQIASSPIPEPSSLALLAAAGLGLLAMRRRR